jgi:ASC-1-like (ASCH) protein
MQHLVYVHPKIIPAIMDGYKVCESRLSKIPHPARRVEVGDELLFKVTGGDVELYACVERVEHYSDLRPVDIDALRDLYSANVDVPGMDMDAYWSAKSAAKYASFIWLTDLCALRIPKAKLPSSRMGWIAGYPA